MIYTWQKITGMQFLVPVCTSTVSLKLFQSKNLTSTEQRGFWGRGGQPDKGRSSCFVDFTQWKPLHLGKSYPV